MNRREFAEQFQAVHRRLWLVAASCVGDRTEADDLVQEAAIIAYQKRSEFRSGTNFAAWLTQIVRHCAANYKRKTAGRRTFPTDPDSLDRVPKAPTTDAVIEIQEQLTPDQLNFGDEIFQALRQLSVMARCCLLLRIVDGATYDEISQQLDIPEGTAMSHVHRSKKLIRERLGKRPGATKEGQR